MDNPMEFHVEPTSRRTADSDDIILRIGDRIRLIFRPMLVTNPGEPDACVRGEFRYQKKSVADDWEEFELRSLSELTIEERGFKLELHAGEVKQLMKELTKLSAIYGQEGIPRVPETFTVAAGSVGDLIKALLERKAELDMLDEEGVDLLGVLVEVLLHTENPARIATALSSWGTDAAAKLGTASQVAQLGKLLDVWRTNLNNSDEDWWQAQFEDNAWVLPQVFGQPFVLLQGQAFMGGKRLDNRGGHVLDLAYKNALTENVALVEIKTPRTRLLGTEVRDKVWALSPELSGSVSQLLTQKDDLQKEYYTRVGLTRRDGGQHFEVFNPKCILLVGNIGAEFPSDAEKTRCLDLARNDFRSVELITYDEMVLRLELLLQILTGQELETEAPGPAATPADDIPF